jgi:hypothetical protein
MGMAQIGVGLKIVMPICVMPLHREIDGRDRKMTGDQERKEWRWFW